MNLVHLELKEANELVGSLHRHHKPVVGHRFSLGVEYEGKLIGAAIIGRPVARGTDQKSIVEVTRLVTDGTPNACSFLYGAAARAAKALGYSQIQTFILNTEPGTSLKASGWEFKKVTPPPAPWHPERGRSTGQLVVAKQKWSKDLGTL